jgi:ribulose bisphosphate carboxylase small subunit
LAYQSERDTWQAQQYRKANAIREQLGWKAGIAHADGEKPKGMHWKTFNKLKAEHDFRVQRILGHTMAWCAKVQRKL